MVRHLNALEIGAKLDGGKIIVTVPTFRSDMVREADAIEEIARIHGYENIQETLPSVPLQGKDSDAGRFVENLRQALMSCGMQEVLTHSVIDPVNVELTGYGDKILSLRNPLSEDVSKMRTMLAANLLQVIARNQSVGIRDLGVFEIGKVYSWSDKCEIDEHRSAAGAMVGSQWDGAWSLNREALAADFYMAKGALESALGRIGIKGLTFVATEHPLLHATRAAAVKVGDVEIGIIGEVSPDAREKLDLRGRPCVFEFNVEKLMPLVPETVGYRQLPRFPALHRHLAVVMSKDIAYADAEKAIIESGGEIIEEIELLDVYRGPQVGENEQNLTFSLVFRSPERTLTDEEVNKVLESVKSKLASAFGASFRG